MVGQKYFGLLSGHCISLKVDLVLQEEIMPESAWLKLIPTIFIENNNF